jgi:ATP-dependent protease ClpP protease subunit
MSLLKKSVIYKFVFLFLLCFCIFSNKGFATSEEKTTECFTNPPPNIGHGLPNVKKEVCYVVGDTLIVEGVIGEVTLEALRSPKNNIKKVYLNSPGGNTNIANVAAVYIRQNRIETYLAENSICASSCTLVYQAGITRSAYPRSRLLYHCVGLGGFATMIFAQSCGTDLNNLTPSCAKDLQDFQDSSTIGTEKHFEQYLDYDSADMFRFLMGQPDDKNWFEQGNFCKKKVIISAEESMKLNVVQKLIYD